MDLAKIKVWRLVAAIAICQLAGLIGSYFTVSSVLIWYPTLNKPFFNPPSYLFGPVWLILYLLMGISLYLVWSVPKNKNKREALTIFGVQLFLNSLWSIIFFGMQSLFWAFVEIVILWVAIGWTIVKFYKISKRASYLLVPYIIWVTFAMILNLAILLLN